MQLIDEQIARLYGDCLVNVVGEMVSFGESGGLRTELLLIEEDRCRSLSGFVREPSYPLESCGEMTAKIARP